MLQWKKYRKLDFFTCKSCLHRKLSFLVLKTKQGHILDRGRWNYSGVESLMLSTLGGHYLAALSAGLWWVWPTLGASSKPEEEEDRPPWERSRARRLRSRSKDRKSWAEIRDSSSDGDAENCEQRSMQTKRGGRGISGDSQTTSTVPWLESNCSLNTWQRRASDFHAHIFFYLSFSLFFSEQQAVDLRRTLVLWMTNFPGGLLFAFIDGKKRRKWFPDVGARCCAKLRHFFFCSRISALKPLLASRHTHKNCHSRN